MHQHLASNYQYLTAWHTTAELPTVGNGDVKSRRRKKKKSSSRKESEWKKERRRE
jgi:hypothetical protein